MSNDYMEFGFGSGDESIGGGKFERFKAKEGESYRVSFVWWPTDASGRPNLDAPSPRFIGAKRHYLQGVGYFLSKGPEYDKIAGGAPKAQIATVIAIWPTDRKGQLDKTRFAQGDVDVKPWIFGQDKYDQLKRRHDEFPFGQYDLNIACTDTQFQKMDLSPARENLFRKAMESDKLKGLVDGILAKVGSIVAENDKKEPVGLRGIIARDLDISKIREKLGGASASSGAAFTADTTSQVDAILDDILDPK